ncbi:MAG TPA: glycogen/starch synthase, partial [Terriglobia bacterium]|nr:glycogen/starch synthase [Terriglobia bacterium]
MSSLHVVMVAGECVPFAKVGGLGDVIGALPLALEKLGVKITVVIPRHGVIDLAKYGFEPYPVPGTGSVPLGFESVPYDVHHGKLPGSSVNVFLIGNDRFFDRPGIYVDPATAKDYPDQADRWIFFQRAVLEFFNTASPAPDILHCHDHQTGLIPAYLRKFYQSQHSFAGTRSMFTIHNMGYQGLFPRDTMIRAGFSDAEFYPASPFEFYGMLNFMKVGIIYADMVTTVSPTYAHEIQSN